MPNSASRRLAFSISASAMGVARALLLVTSGIKLQHGLDHRVLLLAAELGLDGQRDHPLGGRLAGRKRAAPVAQVGEAGLQMQRERIVPRVADAPALERRLQLV